MNHYLKPLFIWAKVEETLVNKMMVDGGINKFNATLFVEENLKI